MYFFHKGSLILSENPFLTLKFVSLIIFVTFMILSMIQLHLILNSRFLHTEIGLRQVYFE